MGKIIYEYKNRFHYLHFIVSVIVLQMRIYVETAHYFRHQISMFKAANTAPYADTYLKNCHVATIILVYAREAISGLWTRWAVLFLVSCVEMEHRN